MENKPGNNVFTEKGIDKKLNNMLCFDDFEKNWSARQAKKTKRTEVGLDIIEEKMSKEEFLEMIGKGKKGKKDKAKKAKKGCKKC